MRWVARTETLSGSGMTFGLSFNSVGATRPSTASARLYSHAKIKFTFLTRLDTYTTRSWFVFPAALPPNVIS